MVPNRNKATCSALSGREQGIGGHVDHVAVS